MERPAMALEDFSVMTRYRFSTNSTISPKERSYTPSSYLEASSPAGSTLPGSGRELPVGPHYHWASPRSSVQPSLRLSVGPRSEQFVQGLSTPLHPLPFRVTDRVPDTLLRFPHTPGVCIP